MTAVDAVCSGCGRRPQVHSCVEDPGALPEPGDVSMCWRCLAPSVFELSPLGVLVLAPPSVEQERELMTHPALAAAIRAREEHPGDPYAAVAAAHEQIRGAR